MAAPWPFIERMLPGCIGAFQALASFCLYLPPETGNAFFETSMESSQHPHLVFDILKFVLIERQQFLFTDRHRLWQERDPGAFEDLFDLLGGKTKTQVHLDRLHAFDSFLIEVAIPVLQPASADQLLLLIVA